MRKRSALCVRSAAGLLGLCLALASVPAVAENLTMTFDAPDYRIVEKTEALHSIEMDDFHYMLTPGKPMLPARTFLIAVPPGATINSVRIIDNGSVELDGSYRIPPAPPCLPGSGDPTLVAQLKREWRANYDATYSSDRHYPEVVGEYRGPGQLRKYSFAVVTYTPFSYQPQSGKLSLISSVTVSIDYTVPSLGESVRPIRMHDAKADEQAAELLANFDQARIWYTPTEALSATAEEYDYIIIYADGLQQAAEDFRNGASITDDMVAVSVSDIGAMYTGFDLGEKIRNFLIEKYTEWGVQWVLLLGDITDIPMRYCFPVQWERDSSFDYCPPTDYYYADLTGDWDSDGDGYYGEYPQDAVDFYPELHVGRIPFSDVDTVTSILEKILVFQFDMGAWKNNALLLGTFIQFENQDNEILSETDDAVLMERIRTDLLGDFNCITEYEKAGLHVSDYECDYPLNKDNVLGQWTAGDFGIVNWGSHGNSSSAVCWYWDWDDGDGVPELLEILHPAFIHRSDVPLLHNDHPSIVYSNSCLNARPESDNLAKNLLYNGAVGVIASTRVCFTAPGWSSPSDGGSASIDYYFMDNMISGGQRIGEALSNSKIINYNNFFYWGWMSALNMYSITNYGDPYTLLEGEERPGVCVIRGDIDHDGAVVPTDAAYFVSWLWRGGPEPPCLEEADVNGDDGVDPADCAYFVNFMWNGGPAPVPCP